MSQYRMGRVRSRATRFLPNGTSRGSIIMKVGRRMKSHALGLAFAVGRTLCARSEAQQAGAAPQAGVTPPATGSSSLALESALKKMDAVAASLHSAQANFEWQTYEKVVDEV